MFLEHAGFSAVAANEWGNRARVIGNFDSWPDYDPAVHTLENEPEFPIVVWAFARRAGARTPLDPLISYDKAARRKFLPRAV